MSHQRTWLAIGLGGVAACVLLGTTVGSGHSSSDARSAPAVTESQDSQPGAAAGDTTPGDSTPGTTTPLPPATNPPPFVNNSGLLSDPNGFQKPYPDAKVQGILTFRGNLTRSFDGTGPIPRTQPQILWKYPATHAMCGSSSEWNSSKTWCGTGWTGQPAVFERDGKTWVVFGAYDFGVHFVDADTGKDIIPPFKTKDLAKGNVTVDPDGYPLVYEGSRDNYFRIIAFDGDKPRELYSVNAQVPDGLWNNDWDGAALVIGDYLIEGCENSWLYGWKLNRGYAADGTVTVNPKLVFRVKGWDDQQLADLRAQHTNNDPHVGPDDHMVSIENSVSVSGNTLYFNNSGGLLQAWDLSKLLKGAGSSARTFRFWDGDDSDATVVPTPDGFIYSGVEGDRVTKRSLEVGNLLKIDPSKPDNPVVWSIKTPGVDNGTWSTPAFLNNTVVWPTKPGVIYGINKADGTVLWKLKVSGPVLSSPNIVDGVLIQADGSGVIHAWDLGDGTTTPTELWTVNIGRNIESTPAIWKGRIYVGSRDGYEYAIGLPT